MTKTSFLVAVVLMASAGGASAGGQAGSFGVGADYQLSGLGGASLNYDAGQFHVGGFFGFVDPSGRDNTLFELGARFYYHLHSTAMSDFGVGGNLGIASVPPLGMATNRTTDVFLEPGFQIRVFLASNVALSFSGGMVIGMIDAPNNIVITAQGVSGSVVDRGGGAVALNAGAGIHYYFF